MVDIQFTNCSEMIPFSQRHMMTEPEKNNLRKMRKINCYFTLIMLRLDEIAA